MAKTAIQPTRLENFSQWYQQVIQAADLAENSPVRGCMVIKPYGYAIWENIQKIFDDKIKKLGVLNAYFPLLIPIEYLSKEAEHIDGFAKECAVVTHSRLTKNSAGELIPDGKLASPYIIRPTSEAIIGSVISKWINTYRDLPLKLNQWCNVMRWEMRPRLFLRTSEFLWQEGHNVFASSQEAQNDALKMCNVYYDFITNELAMPAIIGMKTDEEKFPGAENTYTVEVMMQDGKALQASTSHYLGQTFSAAFDIKFLGNDNKEHIAYTTSWGMSTRLIGGIIMTHSDDNGLVLPPSIAPHQVVIIPIIHDESKTEEIQNYCTSIETKLNELNIRVYIDYSSDSTPNKIWKWVKKGAPIRLEIGFRELTNKNMTLCRRDSPKDNKQTLEVNEVIKINEILSDISNNLRNRSIEYRDQKIQHIEDLDAMENLFASKFAGFASIDLDLTNNSKFESIAMTYSLTRRCVPLNVAGEVNVSNKVLVSRSY